jgi:hypothetical protein
MTSDEAPTRSSSRPPEWWILGWPTARTSSQMAMQCEAAGWDGGSPGDPRFVLIFEFR